MENPSESIFINRELSWLDFDSRVLALAKEKTVPLGERIKFAAIFGSNMDEFFMVRVGSLYDQTLLKNNKTDNVTHMTAAEQIAEQNGAVKSSKSQKHNLHHDAHRHNADCDPLGLCFDCRFNLNMSHHLSHKFHL